MLQGQFAEFLQLYSFIALVYSTYSLVSDLIRCAVQEKTHLVQKPNAFSIFLDY